MHVKQEGVEEIHPSPTVEDEDMKITKSFMKEFFQGIQEETKVIKEELKQNLKKKDNFGNRVNVLEMRNKRTLTQAEFRDHFIILEELKQVGVLNIDLQKY